MAKLLIKCETGRQAELGTITAEVGGGEAQVTGLENLSRRVGWEFVREGLRLLVGRQKWRVEEND